MFLIVVEDAVTMTTATLQDSTEKKLGSSEPKLIILYYVSCIRGGVYGLCLAPTINIERTSSEKTQNFCHRVQKLSILTGDCY